MFPKILSFYTDALPKYRDKWRNTWKNVIYGLPSVSKWKRILLDPPLPLRLAQADTTTEQGRGLQLDYSSPPCSPPAWIRCRGEAAQASLLSVRFNLFDTNGVGGDPVPVKDLRRVYIHPVFDPGTQHFIGDTGGVTYLMPAPTGLVPWRPAPRDSLEYERILVGVVGAASGAGGVSMRYAIVEGGDTLILVRFAMSPEVRRWIAKSTVSGIRVSCYERLQMTPVYRGIKRVSWRYAGRSDGMAMSMKK